MNKATLATITGSAVVAVFLAFVLALPAAARPWTGNMWDGSQGDPITIDEARERVSEYLDEIDETDLTVGEVMQFDNHFYAAVVDEATDNDAFEVLISLDGRSVHPEPGPNMMWNSEYSPIFGDRDTHMHQGMGAGMMGSMHGSMHGDESMGSMHRGRSFGDAGMMGGMNRSMMGSGDCAGGMGYLTDTATELDELLTDKTVADYVQDWLDAERSGVTASDPIAFPGYFTLHTELDGEFIGMLSVNAETGEIWEHTWHGEFVAIEHGDHQ